MPSTIGGIGTAPTAPPSANGTNGHAAVPPPSTNGAVGAPAGPPPSTNGADGRDARGRFAPGNKGGPGNPFARLRSLLLDQVSDDDLAAIAKKLVEQARAGDVAAARLVLAYTVGKPAETVDPDRLDLDEWRLAQESAALGDVMDHQQALDPNPAAHLVRTIQGRTTDVLLEKTLEARTARAAVPPTAGAASKGPGGTTPRADRPAGAAGSDGAAAPIGGKQKGKAAAGGQAGPKASTGATPSRSSRPAGPAPSLTPGSHDLAEPPSQGITGASASGERGRG